MRSYISISVLSSSLVSDWMQGVRRILVRGVNAPLPRRKFWKFDYEMVHSEVYLNTYVVSIAPFSTPACPDALKIFRKLLFFRFLIFHPFSTGVSWPNLPLCADAHMTGCEWRHAAAAAAEVNLTSVVRRCREVGWVGGLCWWSAVNRRACELNDEQKVRDQRAEDLTQFTHHRPPR